MGGRVVNAWPRITSGKSHLGTHCTGERVDFGVGLDGYREAKIPCPTAARTPDSPAVANRYTDYVIGVPVCMNFFFYGSTALYGPGPPRFVEVS
jgi:hypothetical protein